MKIGIIGAQIEEINPILEKLSAINEITIANQKFFTGTLLNHEIILLQCGMGKVNAAIGSTLLIQNHNPAYVINIGSAGGLSKTLNIGDVIVSSEIRYHDVDLTSFGYEYGQAPQMPAYFEPDKRLLIMADQCFTELTHGFHIKKGLVLSGDSFITDPNQIKLPKNNYSDLCAEMEAGAIAQVCYVFKIPFLIIRSISDKIDEENNKEFYEKNLNHAAVNSSELLLKMIEML